MRQCIVCLKEIGSEEDKVFRIGWLHTDCAVLEDSAIEILYRIEPIMADVYGIGMWPIAGDELISVSRKQYLSIAIDAGLLSDGEIEVMRQYWDCFLKDERGEKT